MTTKLEKLNELKTKKVELEVSKVSGQHLEALRGLVRTQFENNARHLSDRARRHGNAIRILENYYAQFQRWWETGQAFYKTRKDEEAITKFNFSKSRLVSAWREAVRFEIPDGYVFTSSAGNLQKRIKKLFKQRGIEVSPEVLSEISDIISKARNGSRTAMDFNTDFNWNSGDFGDRGSCYWTDREYCRRFMQNDARFGAVRFFDSEGKGIARAWTYYDEPSDSVVVWNAYGYNLEVIAKRVAQYLNVVNEKTVRLYANNDSVEYLYINNGHGIVLGEYAFDKLNMKVDVDPYREYNYECDDCGAGTNDVWSVWNGNHVCHACYQDHYFLCERCNEAVETGEGWDVRIVGRVNGPNATQSWCPNCQEDHTFTCDTCDNLWSERYAATAGGGTYCPNCIDVARQREAEQNEAE